MTFNAQPFETVALNVTGPSYPDRSRPLSSQETRNFYQELIPSGKDQYVIKSFPGQKVFGSTTAGTDRGMHLMLEVAFRVIDTTLYEVSSTGTHTPRGDILSLGRCIFADDGINLFIVAGGIVNKYDSSTEILSIVTDPDIVGAQSVTFMNNQFVYTFPLLSVVSDVGDGSSASGLNAVNAERNPDDLVRDYMFGDYLYRFCKRSCEPWWNSGVETPPIEKLEGLFIYVGLGAIHSVSNSKEFIYWLGSDSQVYRASAGQEELISTAAVSAAFQSYFISDAFSEVFTIDNKTCYLLSFPTEQKTWCLLEELGIDGWFELSQGIEDIFNGKSILEVYNKVLVGDDNGNLNELDFQTYDIAGQTWQRRRVMSAINGDAFEQKGREVQMSRLEFILEAGTGTSGAVDPKIMIEASYDGGKSWDTGDWLRIGREGELVRAEWFNLRVFHDMIPRITTTDPVAISIYSGAIDMRLTGGT